MATNKLTNPEAVDLRLEVAVIEVSEVDRANTFCVNRGRRVDADPWNGDDDRIIQVRG